MTREERREKIVDLLVELDKVLYPDDLWTREIWYERYDENPDNVIYQLDRFHRLIRKSRRS